MDKMDIDTDRAAKGPGSGHDVASDMAALFGSDVRPDSASATPRRVRATPARGRRGLVALGVGGLVASIAAGFFVGTSVVGPLTEGPAAVIAARGPSTRALPKSVDATPPAIGPVQSPGAVTAELPAELPIISADRARDPVPPERNASVVRSDMVPAPRRAPTPADTARRADADATVSPVRRRQGDCLDDPACATTRLYAADGDVAGAYQDAASVGVRARTLREYRSEWLRTRELAKDDPGEAMRIYGMIAADLRSLAADVERDDRPTWQ